MNAELKRYLRLKEKMRKEWAEDRREAGRVAIAASRMRLPSTAGKYRKQTRVNRRLVLRKGRLVLYRGLGR